jgi:hypothetical protein
MDTDMEQLGKIINAVKTAKMLGDMMQTEDSSPLPSQSSSQSQSPASEPAAKPDEVGLCAFDKELQSPAIRSIKAAIPYLDSKYQRNMGIMVKLMEMDRLINHYTILATESGADKSKEMLLAVRNELPKQNRPAADLLMKFMEMLEIIRNQNLSEI